VREEKGNLVINSHFFRLPHHFIGQRRLTDVPPWPMSRQTVVCTMQTVLFSAKLSTHWSPSVTFRKYNWILSYYLKMTLLNVGRTDTGYLLYITYIWILCYILYIYNRVRIFQYGTINCIRQLTVQYKSLEENVSNNLSSEETKYCETWREEHGHRTQGMDPAHSDGRQDGALESKQTIHYCKCLFICGVPICVVFVDGLIHKYKNTLT
jgi:hypothetical protein